MPLDNKHIAMNIIMPLVETLPVYHPTYNYCAHTHCVIQLCTLFGSLTDSIIALAVLSCDLTFWFMADIVSYTKDTEGSVEGNNAMFFFYMVATSFTCVSRPS